MRQDSKKGVLLAMEGIDGCGKTKQVGRLASLLNEKGIPFALTKEPTDGPWGRMIRQSGKIGRLPAEDELHAFLEDRRVHVATVIKPALEQRKVVLVDRYYLSTVAYQGARGLDPQRILAANSFAPAPDLLIILDIPPSVGLRRIRERGDRADLFEKGDELMLARAIFNNLDLPNLYRLDGTMELDTLTAMIFRLLEMRMALARKGDEK